MININMCANTNTNTTIVTTLSTQEPTLCRFSTSDSSEQVFGACKKIVFVSKVPKCLESAEMQGFTPAHRSVYAYAASEGYS